MKYIWYLERKFMNDTKSQHHHFSMKTNEERIQLFSLYLSWGGEKIWKAVKKLKRWWCDDKRRKEVMKLDFGTLNFIRPWFSMTLWDFPCRSMCCKFLKYFLRLHKNLIKITYKNWCEKSACFYRQVSKFKWNFIFICLSFKSPNKQLTRLLV